MPACSIVFDCGKTRLKASLIDAQGRILAQQQTDSMMADLPPYPHLRVDDVWQWLLNVLTDFARLEADIRCIIPVTHGATAAVLAGDRLAFPVMDYEWILPESADSDYEALARDYSLTGSPALPAGLNLGRQLYWLRQARDFRNVTAILLYPQYWAWRLSGVMASEITSLGCHTDLWNIAENRMSSWLERLDIARLFPALRPAWDRLGPILPAVAARTGLPPECMVVNGIHDSNATYLRYLAAGAAANATAISTGTWVVVFAGGADPRRLDPARDMLANIDSFGKPVPCARFMGGREYEAIAGSSSVSRQAGFAEIQSIIDSKAWCWPSFAPQGGPYRQHTGSIQGDAAAVPLACLYLALLTEDVVRRFETHGDVYIDGPFAANAAYTGILAALLAPRRVFISDDIQGTTLGAWLLGQPSLHATLPALQVVSPWALNGLADYQSTWRAGVAQRDAVLSASA
ncbi:FGGY family carbohydrate kinase [Ferrovibrio terrae]|uniref:FGGY-family carbohydrate kinase n=1 Tax=Ferrovibrio terrae TaxID=2594003 RepID=UPI003137E244